MARIRRPWGWYHVIAQGKQWKIKLLYLKAWHRTSLQRHQSRTELWIGLAGQAYAYCPASTDGTFRRLAVGDDPLWIGRREPHLLDGGGQGGLLLELQQGTCRERDIKRLSDDYGRASHARP